MIHALQETFMYRLKTATLLRAFALALVIPAVACKKKDEGASIEPAASTSDTTPAAASPLRVADITVGRGLNPDKTVTNETGDFGVQDTIYASVRTEGTSAGSKLTAKWTYQTGQGVSESSLDVAPKATEARHEFHVKKAGAWPKGNYKVEILLDGKSAGSKDFTVK